MKSKIAHVLLLFAVCLAAPKPALAILAETASITYVDEAGERRIFAFVKGDNGHLVVNQFNGTSWSWVDHGLPPGATSVGRPAAITYVDTNLHRRIYVFVKTNTDKLALRYWNGSQWQWVLQGGPELFGTISAITYVDPSGNRRIYAFAVEAEERHHLIFNYWNGSVWQWADNGVPAGGKPTTADAITYLDEISQRRIDVFSRGAGADNFPLFVNSWNGSNWSWSNHGQTDVGRPSPVTYVDALGGRRIYAFAKRANQLWANFWNGVSWQWVGLGTPVGAETSILYDVSAIAFTDNQANRKLYAFTDWSGRLFAKIWNGSVWSWANLGIPAGAVSVSYPRALTFVDERGGTQRIYVFTRAASNGHLMVNYWNGSTWQWLDNGTM